jgi:hypothetical protein
LQGPPALRENMVPLEPRVVLVLPVTMVPPVPPVLLV